MSNLALEIRISWSRPKWISPVPKPRLLRYFSQDPERIEERLVVRRLATLVVLGIRLQVDLVPELGVPIDKKTYGKMVSSVTAGGCVNIMTDDRCVEIRPGMYHSRVRLALRMIPLRHIIYHPPSIVHTQSGTTLVPSQAGRPRPSTQPRTTPPPLRLTIQSSTPSSHPHTRPASSLTVGYLFVRYVVLGRVGGGLEAGLGGRMLRLVDSY
jgi:hypothetical protein